LAGVFSGEVFGVFAGIFPLGAGGGGGVFEGEGGGAGDAEAEDGETRDTTGRSADTGGVGVGLAGSSGALAAAP
jgi:hypothetical protein